MLKKIVLPLCEWYNGNARELPWREDISPYRVWISEIMLQQTRVEAVIPFFMRFTEALPDLKALAECPEDQLLKLWEGLGYYNRVRNMQKTAIRLVDEYDAAFPADYEALLTLPGIGSYTAGAIASIAFGILRPAVDGNVMRVIARIAACDDDISKISVRNHVEAILAEIIPRQHPGIFNQALMELGALVCIPNGVPKCEVCPVAKLCLARKQGIVMELPKKTLKRKRRIEALTVLVIRDGERLAIRKRAGKGLLAGLYELPNLAGHCSGEQVLTYLKGQGLDPLYIESIGEGKHIFSHVEWQMIGYSVQVADLSVVTPKDQEYLFVEISDMEENYPIPVAFSAYTNQLQIKLGQKKYQIAEEEDR